MTVDLLLWILAFVCFVIATLFHNRFADRVDLIALGLAFGSLTFII